MVEFLFFFAGMTVMAFAIQLRNIRRERRIQAAWDAHIEEWRRHHMAYPLE